MFKIGEFSKLVRVSPRMLRYYEQNGLLEPAEVDRFTGYRLYSSLQMPLLSRITQLRDMGFGVEEIKGLLLMQGDRAAMRDALSRKYAEVQAAIALEQAKLANIAAFSGQLQEVNMVFPAGLKSLPAEKVLSLREIIPSCEREFDLWDKLRAFAVKRNIELLPGGYSIYHDEDYKETDTDIEIAVPVASFGKNEGSFVFKELPAVDQAATVVFRGSYEGYADAFTALAQFIEDKGLEMAGVIRGKAIVAPVNTANPDEYETELQVAVKKA
ncbi:MAG: MerR family transcriptional regulator [Clostridiales bacterium]|jgi:DNA-binding transcriptional MerR regulator/effector-binding domain-containing protein|nr:MerR family transcriptional regulator [Clostridiales bacterium]